MLKLLGSILVMAASVGFAWCIRREMNDHLSLLYEIRRMLVALSCDAAYGRWPVEVLLERCSGCRNVQLEAVFHEIAARLGKKQEGNGPLVWQEVFLEHEKELGLTWEEAETIRHAGSAFFGKSLEENQRQLAQTLEQMDFLIETRRGGQKERQRVGQAVTVLCGLMVIILLL